jgi:hypothetical protein
MEALKKETHLVSTFEYRPLSICFHIRTEQTLLDNGKSSAGLRGK